MMTIAAVVLALAGVLLFVFGWSSPNTPRSRLDGALVATKSAVTADVTMAIKVSFGGVSFSVTATGTVDFPARSTSLRMNAFGQTLAFVETNDVLYANIGKLIGTQFPGKTWVRIPVSAVSSESGSGSELFLASNPQAMMAALVKLGATITPIGTTVIDGTQDQGYRIDLTLSELRAHASELPPWLRSFLSGTTAPETATFSTTMYVDPAGQLQAADIDFSGAPTGHTVAASVDLTLSDFGTARAPTAPPSTRTVTFQELKGSLGSAPLPFTLRTGTESS